jgi:hypothetical protein
MTPSPPAETETCEQQAGLQISSNAFSHKISGLRFTGFGELDELRGDGLFD